MRRRHTIARRYHRPISAASKEPLRRALWGRSLLPTPPSILSPARCPRLGIMQNRGGDDDGGVRSRSSLIRINSADVASVAAAKNRIVK